MVICLERGADLHMAQRMPLPLAVSCFSKIQFGFTFLVPAHPGSPWQRAVEWVCVRVRACVCVCVCVCCSISDDSTVLVVALVCRQYVHPAVLLQGQRSDASHQRVASRWTVTARAHLGDSRQRSVHILYENENIITIDDNNNYYYSFITHKSSTKYTSKHITFK